MMRRLNFLIVLMALVCASNSDALAQVNNVMYQDNWPRPNSAVLDMVMSNGTLYIVGGFTEVGGVTRRGAAALDSATGTLLSWNPDVDQIYFQPTNSYQSPIAIAKKGDTVFIGGYFQQVGGQSRKSIAAVDATTGAVLPWEVQIRRSYYDGISSVYKLLVHNNTLYISGDIDSVNGVAQRGIVAVDATTGVKLPFDAIVNNPASDMKISNGKLYMIGNFTNAGNETRLGAASVDPVTGAVTSWNPIYSAYPWPLGLDAMAISGNTVYLGGFFWQIQGQERNYACAVDATTGALLPWNPNLGWSVFDIAVAGNTVYMGGKFIDLNVPYKIRNRAAAVNTTTGAVKSWNPNISGPVNTLLVSGNSVYMGGWFLGGAGGDSSRKNLIVVSKQSDIVAGSTVASQTSGCAPGYTVNLSLNGTSGADAYQWQSSSNDTTWTDISGATNTTYSLFVNATTFFRCKLTASGTEDDYSQSKQAKVNPLVTPTINITDPSPICYGAYATNFTSSGNVGGYPTKYVWKKDGVVVQNDYYTNYYDVTGITKYTPTVITLTVSNFNIACATATTATDTLIVQAVSTPNPVVTASGTKNFCEGDSVTFINTPNASNPNMRFSWGIEDLDYFMIEVSSNTTYTAKTSGNYVLIVTDTTTGCSRVSSWQHVNVKPNPVVNASANGALDICSGSTVTLSNSVSEASVSYRWKRDGITNVSTTSSYAAKTAGSYTLTATLNGCSDTSAPYNVTVIPVPDVTVSANGSTALCPDTNVLLSAVNNGGYTYQWYNGANPIDGQTTGEYLATTAGSYKVAISNEGCAPKNSAATKVTLTTLPGATITQTASSASSVTLRGNNGTVYGYQWYKDGNAITNAISQTYNASQNGTYLLELKRNNCSVMSAAKVINSITDPSDFRLAVAEEEQRAISIYPNPSDGIFNIASDEAVNVIVRDVQGRVVANITNASSIDLTAQLTGMYLMQITDAKGTLLQSERLIKK